jgi:hypothetical protein
VAHGLEAVVTAPRVSEAGAGYNGAGEDTTDLRQNITATVRPGDSSGFVAECLEIAVVS